MPIDYDRMKRVMPQQRGALTRAKKITHPATRWTAVKDACTKAVIEWNIIGAWPDCWSLWQRTLEDAWTALAHFDSSAAQTRCPKLEDLC